MTSQGDNRFYREQQAADQELRYDEDGLHIYWFDPVEGCWVAFRRVDCVGEEELSERRLPRFEQAHTPTDDEREEAEAGAEIEFPFSITARTGFVAGWLRRAALRDQDRQNDTTSDRINDL